MLLLLLFCISTVLSLVTAELHQTSLLESKCDAYPGRSLFYKSSCYLIIETDTKKCSEVFPMFKVAERQLTDTKLKQLKFLREKETTFANRGDEFLSYKEQLCVLSTALQCPPNSELIGSRCFYLNKDKKTQEEAIKDCKNKGMTMFYPHSDEDIKTVIEFADGFNINEIWLSAIKQASGVWKMNDKLSLFDFARWFDTRLISSSKKLYTTLSVGKKTKTSLGYMSMIEKRANLRLPSICTKTASTGSIKVKTTSSTSTTKTTTSTTTTTTKKKTLVCPQGYSSFQGMCYKVVREMDAAGRGKIYYQADAKCRAFPGGNLATIASHEVNVFINNITSTVCRDVHPEYTDTLYMVLIGLRCPNVRRHGDKSTCRWDDGTPFEYNGFNDVVPRINNGQGCTSYDPDSLYYWGNGGEECEQRFGCYVCQSTGI